MKRLYLFIALIFITSFSSADDVTVNVTIDDTDATVTITDSINVSSYLLKSSAAATYEPILNYVSENSAGVQISSSVFSTGISSFTAYYGDGSNLTGIAAAGGWIGTATSDLDMDDYSILNATRVNVANSTWSATGIKMGNLGTSTRGIDFSESGLSGTDNLMYYDANKYWAANGYIRGTVLYVDSYLDIISDGGMVQLRKQARVTFNANVYLGYRYEGNDHYKEAHKVGTATQSGWKHNVEIGARTSDPGTSPVSMFHEAWWNTDFDKYGVVYSSNDYFHIGASHPTGISIDTHTVVNGGLYPQSDSSLPTSGYNEGSLFYNTDDNTLYISTETVTSAESWKSVW